MMTLLYLLLLPMLSGIGMLGHCADIIAGRSLTARDYELNKRQIGPVRRHGEVI